MDPTLRGTARPVVRCVGNAVSMLDKVGWPVVSRRHVGYELCGGTCG